MSLLLKWFAQDRKETLTEIFHSVPQPAGSIFLSRTCSNPGTATLPPAKGALPRCLHSSTWRPAHVLSNGSLQHGFGCSTPAATVAHPPECLAAGRLLHKPLGEVLHPRCQSITALRAPKTLYSSPSTNYARGFGVAVRGSEEEHTRPPSQKAAAMHHPPAPVVDHLFSYFANRESEKDNSSTQHCSK